MRWSLTCRNELFCGFGGGGLFNASLVVAVGDGRSVGADHSFEGAAVKSGASGDGGGSEVADDLECQQLGAQ